MIIRIIFTVALITKIFQCFSQRSEILLIGGFNGSIVKEKGGNESVARYYSTHFGIIGGIGGENILFETGLIRFTRGTNFVTTSSSLLYGSSISSTSLKLNYIDIPLMFVAAPNRIRFFFGPQYSILLSARLEGNGSDLKDSFEKTSWGLRYGIGYNTQKFAAQFHFVNVMSDIYKHPDIKWTNHSLQLSVGYILFSHWQPSKDPKKKRISEGFPEHRKID